MPLRLQVKNLECGAGARVLFEHLSFDLTAGQALVLVGPNGSGKTTLLRALAGLVRPWGGEIGWYTGAHSSEGRVPSAGLCLYQGHQTGWKLEMTAHENLVTQCQLDGVQVHPAEFQTALGRAGIAEQSDLLFGRLSAGQRRRVALARLMLDPRKVWLLDEPTTALDDMGVALLVRLLDHHLGQGGIVVVATHHELRLTAASRRLRLGESA